MSAAIRPVRPTPVLRFSGFRPRLTCDAARRLGLELRYASHPSWACYATLLQSAGQLLEKLRALGARDFIDLESFLHVVTAKRAHAKAS